MVLMRPQFGGSHAVRTRPVLKNPHFDTFYASAGLQHRCCAPVTRFAAVPARGPARLHRIAAAAQREVAEGIRINKCFKASHSRRQADVLIENRRVMLNGKVATAGARVLPGDKVTLDGKPVNWAKHNESGPKATATEHVYIKYWKPKGVVCTTDRTIKGNVIDEIKHPQRIFTVGRLDKDTTGLLLLTDDGRLVNALLRSKHAHRKTYLVRVDRPLKVAALRALRKGVTITTYAQRDGTSKGLTAPTLPAAVQQVDMQTFIMTITEGRNRQIRRMCEAVGYKVIGLHREAVSGITLEGMKMGEWKALGRADRRTIDRVLSTAGATASAE